MRFLLVCDDATYVMLDGKYLRTLPAAHKVYQQGIARANRCTIIVRRKNQ